MMRREAAFAAPVYSGPRRPCATGAFSRASTRASRFAVRSLDRPARGGLLFASELQVAVGQKVLSGCAHLPPG